MGLLRLLGIEKYLKKVKTYVDEENVKDRAYTDKKVSENKAATPDWDAESWEAGYIKNRTHGLADLTVLTKNGETAYGMLETQYLKIQDQLYPISRGETVILRKGPHISVTYENDQLTLNDPEDMAESFGGVIVAIGIHQISEHYIPDTIARKSDLTNVAAPDWNAAEGQSGHIKNRTHYSRNIILSSNESNGKYTYYIDFYESDDKNTAWLSFYDITESRTREISLSELNGFVVDLGYARITFSLVLDQNEGAYYVAVESNTGTVDSRIVDSIAIQTVDKPLNQGFIPDTIARRADIPSVDETLMKYLANPYAIEAGGQIPEDLHNLIYPGPLSPIVMSVCVFYEAIDSMHYAITSHTDFEIYANGQMLSYDSINRVFNYA